MRARVRVGAESVEAEIFNTPAGRAVMEVLPLETSFQTRGDEFCFSVPMHPLPAGEEAGVELRMGDIAYWPEGSAMSIFLGPAPAGPGPEPAVPGPFILLGRITGDPDRLRRSAPSPTLRMELD